MCCSKQIQTIVKSLCKYESDSRVCQRLDKWCRGWIVREGVCEGGGVRVVGRGGCEGVIHLYFVHHGDCGIIKMSKAVSCTCNSDVSFHVIILSLYCT